MASRVGVSEAARAQCRLRHPRPARSVAADSNVNLSTPRVRLRGDSDRVTYACDIPLCSSSTRAPWYRAWRLSGLATKLQ
ncbi:unnamed protein product, partial [Nesidiocoris tenuis]